jgi:hypothetical protein
MKKLLLLALLLIGMMGFAQTKEQFFLDYTKVLSKDKDGNTVGWKELNSRFFFNYGGNSNKVKIYIGNSSFTFSQEGITERGVTEGGIGYQIINLVDDENFEKIFLQYFDLEEYGVRVIFLNGSTIQFAN